MTGMWDSSQFSMIRLSFSRVIVNSLHILYGATNDDRNVGLVTILNVIATVAVTKIANIIKRKVFRIFFNKHFIIVNYTFKSSQGKHIVVINLRRTELFSLGIINGIKSQYLNLLSLRRSKIYGS
nr:MAG TPA: hypothetical protein [Microviridae sp.]